jgi:hypothetical protein
MGWSWFDLTGQPGGTPPYVSRFIGDFIAAEAITASNRMRAHG